MRRTRGRALVCLWAALTLVLPGCGAPAKKPAAAPPPPTTATPAPASKPAADPSERPQIPIDADSPLGSLLASTPDLRVQQAVAQVTALTDAEARAMLARLEPLPDLSATNAKAPTMRPPSLPPPRAGGVQPIAFVVPTGKPVSDAPVAPGKQPDAPPRALMPPVILPTGEVRAESEVRVRFDEAMIPVAAVDSQAALPITFSPPLAGRWKWLDTRVAVFESAGARFPKATDVTVTVPAGIKALSGATLNAPVTGTFSTPPINITKVWPRDVRPDGPIIIAFDQKLDPTKLLPFLKVIGPKAKVIPSRALGLQEAKPLIARNPAWKLTDKVLAELGPNILVLAPKTAWPAGIEAQAALDVGAPSLEGPRVTTQARFGTFHVVPAFRAEGITCDDRNTPSPSAAICSAKGWLSVHFTNAIERSTYRAQKVQIVGQPFDDNTPSGETISLTTPRLPGQAHKIAIGEGIRDIYDQPMVGTRELAFTTTLERFEPQIEVPTSMFVLDPRFEIPQWVIHAEAVTQVRVQLYRVQPSDYFAYTEMESKKRAAPGTLVSDKTYAVGARMGADLRVDLRPALSKANTGHIVAVATAVPAVRVPEWFNRRNVAWIQVSRLGVSARIDGEKLSAWATDISPDSFLVPVGGATAELVEEGRADRPATGVADAGGHVEFQLPAPRPNPKDGRPDGPANELLVLRKGDDSVFVGMYGRREKAIRTDKALWYVTDDRFTYKPGEPVYMKGWIRWTHDGINPDLALPRPGEVVDYRLNDARGNKLLEGTANLTDQGGFDFELKLPPTANLGTATLRMTTRGYVHTHPISIQEFRTPAYSVNLDDDVGHSGAIPLVLGESIEMNAVAKYYAGGGLPGADIKWDATLRTTRFAPAGWDLFKFEPIRKRSDRRYYWRSDDPEPVTVNTQGSLSGSSNASIVYGLAALPKNRTSILEVDATVTDVDRMNIRASSRPILVHPSLLYVGIRLKPDTMDALELIVTDLDGKPVAGVPISVDIEGVLGSERDRDDAKVVETQTCKVTSGDAPVRCAWKRNDIQVAYTATARIADARGRENVTQYDIPWWTWDDKRDLALVPDKASYKPGDVAKLELRSKVLPSTAVVTFARNGIIGQKRLELTQASTTVELPIEPAFISNVHVQVDRWGKRKTLAPGSTQPLPEHDSVSLEIPVSLDTARLVMRTRPTKAIVEPGENATFEVEVKHDDKPIAGAEVALIVVDEAILSLSSRKHEDPLAPFYADLSAKTTQENSYGSVVDMGPMLAGKPGFSRYKLDEALLGRGSGTGSGYGVGGGRGGMRGRSASAPGFSIVESRKDFRATAVFSPRLLTDAAGKVSVTVKMPDSLTRFRIVALATSSTRWFGKAENVVVTQLKVNARTVAPRFLTQGDTFALPVVVQNLDGVPRTIDVAVRAANLVQSGPAGKRVTVAPGQRAEVRFDFATQGRGTAAIQTIASSGNFVDATTVTLPIYEPATTESFATYGTVDDAPKFEQLAVPADIFPDVGGVEVEVASTQLQSLIDAFWYLYAYPYECAEQRSSRMLATAAMLDVLEAFARTGRATRKDIEAQLAYDIKKLVRDQRPDGGWGYFLGMASDPYVTQQVMQALVAHKVTGSVVANAKKYVTTRADKDLASLVAAAAKPPIQRTDRATYPGQVSLIAAGLAALAASGTDVKARARSLHATAVKLEAYPVDAKARVLAILGTEKPIRDALLPQLLSTVHETASSATVAATYAESERLLLVSETKTTALVLDALIRVAPTHALVTKLARGLLDTRKGGRWRSTQENVWVLQAMRRYFDTYEKDTPSFTGKLWLGKDSYAEQEFLGRSTKRGIARADWASFPAGSTNDIALTKSGTGRMYYRVGITYAPRTKDLPALDAGFVVRRSYTAVDDPGDVQKLPDGRIKVKLGARVLVTVEALNTSRRHAVAFVDPLPAGFEAVNTSLANAERSAKGSNSSAWDFQNMRDNRAEAFEMFLAEGTHQLVYTARASTPGVFFAAPAKAEEMYSPETFGRSTGQTVVIE